MGRYYHLVNTFFRERKMIFWSLVKRERCLVMRKKKKKEKSSPNIVWFINYPPKSSVIKHKNHPDSFKQDWRNSVYEGERASGRWKLRKLIP